MAPRMTRTKVMVIMGSGRSCTSGIAKGLHLAGWPMGTDLLPATASQPHGHWEDRAAVTLNDDILAHHNGTWNQPPPISHIDTGLLSRIETYIDHRWAQAGGQWGVKDPRLTWTWPYWSRAFDRFPDLEPIMVAAYRDPVEVARSIVARDRVSAAHAARTVMDYQRRLVALWSCDA